MKFRELFIEASRDDETYTWDIDVLPGSFSGTSLVKDKKKVEKLTKEYIKAHKNIDPDDLGDDEDEDDYYAAYEYLIAKYAGKFEKITSVLY